MKDFKVYSLDPETNRITIALPNPPEVVTGKNKLIQIVLLALMNNPGRNVQYPKNGAGIPSLIGSNIDPTDQTEILADITERIEKIKKEIIQYQQGLKNETPSERLRDLLIVSVNSGTQIDEIVLKFRIVSEAGEEISLVL